MKNVIGSSSSTIGSSGRVSTDQDYHEDGDDQQISKMAISTFKAKEEEIERKKMQVRQKVELQLGRAEEETRRLAHIWEEFCVRKKMREWVESTFEMVGLTSEMELEVLEDPLKKEVAMVRKKIDMTNRDLKPLGQSCQKKEKEYKEALEAFNEKNKEKSHLVATLMELLTESERIRMKKLEELSKIIESMH
ncbi:syncoilin-like isoform X1 [Senna tora]|uniref:Syncoilin-like isoform X1 n=1 Tax=Senna tora TaxID=362788 RepID=A0A834TFY7_9FABA|nr:syncoilin-like isoform X1 [Senna tora]